MPRSVVLKGALRCDGCLLSPRWCVCSALTTVALPLAVDVVQHSREADKPTSTGHLIRRSVPDARLHVWQSREPRMQTELARDGYERWVLHPNGERCPDEVPARVQLVLLDGTWQQAGEMLRTLGSTGRRVCLPFTGQSRYWLRNQHADGNVSTIEALLLALRAMGRTDEHLKLSGLFELQVYAGLLARGKKALAADFRASSPVREELEARLRLVTFVHGAESRSRSDTDARSGPTASGPSAPEVGTPT